jgi:hypothetical protein
MVKTTDIDTLRMGASCRASLIRRRAEGSRKTPGRGGLGVVYRAMRRLFMGLLWAVLGYVVGAGLGGYLVYALSDNRHDLSVEAAMTGAFVVGPLCACVAGVVGAVRAKPRQA